VVSEAKRDIGPIEIAIEIAVGIDTARGEGMLDAHGLSSGDVETLLPT
jgi:hypothetical protein